MKKKKLRKKRRGRIFGFQDSSQDRKAAVKTEQESRFDTEFKIKEFSFSHAACKNRVIFLRDVASGLFFFFNFEV